MAETKRTMGNTAEEASRLAELTSRWIDPRYLVGLVVLVAALRGTAHWVKAVGWTLLTLTIAVLPLLAFIAHQTRRGAFADDQVPEQHLRNQVYLVGNACLLVCLLILVLLRAPGSLVTLLLAMLTSSATASGLNLRWKVSVHTGSVAGAAVSLLALVGPPALPTLVLIPLIGWTRVALRRHTLGQVIAGGLVGGGITTCVFWLMSPL